MAQSHLTLLPAADNPPDWFNQVSISVADASTGLRGFASEDACHKYETTDLFIRMGAAHLLNQFYERYPEKRGKVALVPPESSYHFKDGRYGDFWRSVKVTCRIFLAFLYHVQMCSASNCFVMCKGIASVYAPLLSTPHPAPFFPTHMLQGALRPKGTKMEAIELFVFPYGGTKIGYHWSLLSWANPYNKTSTLRANVHFDSLPGRAFSVSATVPNILVHADLASKVGCTDIHCTAAISNSL